MASLRTGSWNRLDPYPSASTAGRTVLRWRLSVQCRSGIVASFFIIATFVLLMWHEPEFCGPHPCRGGQGLQLMPRQGHNTAWPSASYTRSPSVTPEPTFPYIIDTGSPNSHIVIAAETDVPDNTPIASPLEYRRCKRAELPPRSESTLDAEYVLKTPLRSLDFYIRFAPPFLDMSRTMWDRPRATILDVGCGLGVTALELATRFPHASVACVNQERLGSVQSHSLADLGNVALLHNISVLCTDAGVPKLPILASLQLGIELEPIPFAVAPDAGVSLVLNMHALGDGTIRANSSGVIVGRLARLLRPGGVACLLLTGVSSIKLGARLGAFSVLRVVHSVRLWGRALSLLVYGRRGSPDMEAHIGIYIRRCNKRDLLSVDSVIGCLLPGSPPDDAHRSNTHRSMLAPDAQFADFASGGLLAPADVDSSGTLGEFARHYLLALWGWLDAVPLGPPPRVVVRRPKRAEVPV